MTEGLQFRLENIDRLAFAFYDREVAKVLRSIFRETPPSTLGRFGKERLERYLKKLSEREDVMRVQAAISMQLQIAGESTLHGIAGRVFDKMDLPKKEGGQIGVYPKKYQEVEAYCNSGRHPAKRVAIGRFERKKPLEEIVFTPGKTLYANNLSGIFPNLTLACDSCGNQDLDYKKAAIVYVYRDRVDKKEELADRVKEIIKHVAESTNPDGYKKNPKIAQKSMERRIVDAFYGMFREIKSDGTIDYLQLYRLFEWIRRKNHYIGQMGPLDAQTRTALEIEITKCIPLPYAIIRGRLKDSWRIVEKSIEVMYDIKDSEDSRAESEQRILGDIYALRVIVPEVRDVYNVVKSIKSLRGHAIVKEEDNIKQPRGTRRYQAYHIKLSDGGIVYSVQILTHEMDRRNETAPELQHDEKYLVDKRARISQVPWQVKSVVATVFGVYK